MWECYLCVCLCVGVQGNFLCGKLNTQEKHKYSEHYGAVCNNKLSLKNNVGLYIK